DPESAIKAKDIFETVQKLCSEEMSSRTPGSLGDTHARAFIAEKMAEAKLQPPGAPAAPTPTPTPTPTDDGAAEGSAPSPFVQTLPLTTVRTRLLPGGAPVFKSTAATVPVQVTAGLQDVVLLAGEPKPAVSLRDLEVVFVGYGLSAPEFQWNDYKD